jgi:hypothetical protein
MSRATLSSPSVRVSPMPLMKANQSAKTATIGMTTRRLSGSRVESLIQHAFGEHLQARQVVVDDVVDRVAGQRGEG